MNKISIYTIAISTATLAASPYVADQYSSVRTTVYDSLSLIASQKTITGTESINCRKFLNSLLIRKSFSKRMLERNISNIPSAVEQALFNISEECGNFDIKDVYADYSPMTRAIRIDMVLDKDFFLIVRKTFEDNDDGVAVSLSKGKEQILADYVEMNKIVEKVDKCIKA